MEVKLFEVRDRATFMPVMAIRLTKLLTGDSPDYTDKQEEAERFLLARAGYGTEHGVQEKYILLLPLAGGHGTWTSDPYDERPTLQQAHLHILNNWNWLKTGDVIDVEYITGQTSSPKVSERITGVG